MKIGFVQFQPRFGQIDHNVARAKTLLGKAEGDLMVLPEFFSTGYLFTSRQEALDLAEEIPGGKTTQALWETAREKGMHIVAGMLERSGKKLFNAAVLVSPQGHLATYRKVHLFNEEKLWFDPGDGAFAVYDIGLCKVGIMICFDWFFPESMRVLSLMGADVICHPANLVMPFCQDAMITRCLENRVFAVTANRIGTEKRGGKYCLYTGRSQITGPSANILYRAGSNTEEIGCAQIDVAAARNKSLNDHNDIFADRQTGFYKNLTKR